MPLPEPERVPGEVPLNMMIDTMNDDALFRWTLTEHLRQIGLALVALNENLGTIAAGANATIERQGAVMTELGKITGQLKTLNNAVWDKVDAVYFVEGWVHARGCRVEHHTAKSYGIPTMYEGEAE